MSALAWWHYWEKVRDALGKPTGDYICSRCDVLRTIAAEDEQCPSAEADRCVGLDRMKPGTRRASCTYTIRTFGEKGGKAHIGIGMYPDGSAAEVFINVATPGSDLNTIFDAWALTVSRALQHGVPLSEIAKAVRGVQDGCTKKMEDVEGNQVPCSSMWDAIAQTLERHHG